MQNESPDFRAETFLHEHIRSIHDFYQPCLIDEGGGFYQNFRDDGTVFDKQLRHLVSSSRFVFNQALWFELYREQHYRDALLLSLIHI